ncbi:MAG: hypothetical protein JRC86_00800 [Deltaproteobacteria bacterium]|nr:hypothetical protein [Deltaproteobacteria bacterium]
MPKNDYAAGESIEFSYRCSGDHATANPVATVLDEIGGVFATLTVGSGVEHKHGKTFLVSFVPDEIGTWLVNVVDDHGGDSSKSFGVATHSMAWVVSQLEVINTSLTTLVGVTAALASNDGGGAHIG